LVRYGYASEAQRIYWSAQEAVVAFDAVNNCLLRLQLADAEFALQEAANGVDALCVLREQTWDAELTDQMMPDADR
jgi:CheY-like chemotaxis protein